MKLPIRKSLGHARRSWRGFFPAAALLLVCLAMLGYLRLSGNLVELGVARGYGPASWPTFALFGLAICAGLRLILGLRADTEGQAQSRGSQTKVESANVNNSKVAVAVALIFAYGGSATLIGFMLGTLLFLMAWLYLGGIKRVWLNVTVSTASTVALLYLFTLVVYMPLPRGRGPFEDITLHIYRALGIF